jgi:peroxiredoxin
MIYRSLLFIVIFFSVSAKAQDAQQILKESYAKCLSIKNGYYDMEMKLKFMSDKDTTWDIIRKTYFNKLKNDSLFFIAFNSELFSKQMNYVHNTLYTGKEFVTYSKADSTAQIMTNERWGKDLKTMERMDVISFYGPLTTPDCLPFPNDSDYTNPRKQFKFAGKELLNNKSCYHVQIIEFPVHDSTQTINTIQATYDFWINIRDMIPIKYSSTSRILQFADTLSEYISYALKEYHFNDAKNLIPLQLSVIPAYCNLRDHTEPKTTQLLKDTLAPAFTLPSVDSKPVSLSSYKGKVILIDFFYKDCYPCLQATPVLQALHEKYEAKGLTIIGIDPEDKEADALKHFVSISGITYPVLMGKSEVKNAYHISGYPTLYLIDRKGNVVFATTGFNESEKEGLEDLIRKNL